MPTIELSLKDLNGLVDRKLSAKELEDLLQYAKASLEEIDGDNVKVEIADTNRPDLWSVEGIARQLCGALRIKTGLPLFNVKKTGVAVEVDKKVAAVRPAIVGAVVKGLRLDDKAIAQLIQLQEKICLTYGRKREQAAIGVYDWDRIDPPIKYTTVKPRGIKFVPLDFDRPMTPAEILKKHPKGQEYGHLIAGAKEYPLLIDSAGNVLSIPPIINSALTGKIDSATRNVFVEVTGFDLRIVSIALNVMVAALADRGGKIESVICVYGKRKKINTPALEAKKFVLNPARARGLLGLKISDREIVRLLQEARYGARQVGKKIQLLYPAYRADIMHERDVIEDVAIAFGYNDFEPAPPKLATIGESDPLEDLSDKIRELMIGLGLQEVMTFTLTNYDSLYKKMRYPKEVCAEIANPVSERYTVLRSWLIPSLLELLSKNTHVDYPQKIFEVGDVVWVDEKAETRTENVRTLCIAIAAPGASYTNVKTCLDALGQALRTKINVKAIKCPSFIDGRAAEIFVNGKAAGFIGEIHPEVIIRWNLEIPVAVFEINLNELFKIVS